MGNDVRDHFEVVHDVKDVREMFLGHSDVREIPLFPIHGGLLDRHLSHIIVGFGPPLGGPKSGKY